MKAKLLGRSLCLAALLTPLALQAPSAQGIGNGTVASVIVKFRADSALVQTQAVSESARRLTRTQSLAQRIGVDLSAGSSISGRSHVVSAIGVDARTLATRLAAQPDVEYAVPDEIVRRHAVPNDPFYSGRAYNDPVTPTSGGPLVGQWYLKPPGPG
ncbi:MAG: hypothetical protein M3Z16_11890, partial [Pseudomonadota bacterium]|nr:hypothetical protein [Pseudomonadota bacterium]